MNDAGERTVLEGARAVVTGAAGGVGRALVGMLAEEGATLALAGRTDDSLDPVAALAAERGADRDRVRRYAADLSRDAGPERLAEALSGDLDRVDLLIHCAGAYVQGGIDSVDVDELDRQYRVNARAAYVLTRLLLPALRASAGQVLFVNSSVGVRSRGGVAAYAASKHALRAVADGLRDEVNPDGVRVTTVFLGRTATPMQERVHEIEGRPYRPSRLIQPADVAAAAKAVLSLPRTAEVTDLHLRPMKKPG